VEADDLDDGGDLLRERVRLYLLSIFSARRCLAQSASSFEESFKAENRRLAETLTTAFCALGTLSETEALSWKARFDRDLRPPIQTKLARRDVHPHVEVFLDRLLQRLDLALDPATERAVITRFEGALMAFIALHLLDPRDAHAWRSRFKPVSSCADKASSTETTVISPAGLDLLTVVPGPQERFGGLRIASAELYSDAVCLHWHLLLPKFSPLREGVQLANDHSPFSDPRAVKRPAFDLTDDRVTAYSFVGESTAAIRGSPVEVYWGTSWFVPGIPREATRLICRGRGSRVEMQLGTRDYA
jgi:hypothetical protein